jgi:uncharacterized repeat protein (TIGR03837 family)
MRKMPAAMTRSWDIFCSVVDNYGDIGVCWRLARQLAGERGQKIRLWVDDVGSFHQLCHEVDTAKVTQYVQGIEIRHWTRESDIPLPESGIADIVIEAFGVRLPAYILAAMAQRNPAPVWVNLEYLSAEHWVETHHGLPSPHPELPLTRYFFFPGFTAETGGLLVERGLTTKREAFQADSTAIAEFRLRLGMSAFASARWVSLFCYDNAALPSLIAAWAASAEHIICVVPEGQAAAQIAVILGRAFPIGMPLENGSLTLLPVPFLEQDDYDRLLWICDVNFVRGEDSFVRAQLAARPFIWQAYPQSEDTHLVKMHAFLDRYAAGLDAAAVSVQTAMFDAWNWQRGDAGACWNAFSAGLGNLARHAGDWAARIAQGKNLAESLAQFCENKLK